MKPGYWTINVRKNLIPSTISKAALLCGVLIMGSLLPCSAQSNEKRHTKGMEKLAFLQGRWGVTVYMKAKDDTFQVVKLIGVDDSDSTNRVEFKSIFKGNYFQVNGELGFHFTLTIGYDQWRDKYVLISFEDGPGLIDIYQGNFDDSGNLVFTNLEVGTHYVQAGEKHFNRMIFTDVSANGFTWFVDDSTEGKDWKRVSRYTFSR